MAQVFKRSFKYLVLILFVLSCSRQNQGDINKENGNTGDEISTSTVTGKIDLQQIYDNLENLNLSTDEIISRNDARDIIADEIITRSDIASPISKSDTFLKAQKFIDENESQIAVFASIWYDDSLSDISLIDEDGSFELIANYNTDFKIFLLLLSVSGEASTAKNSSTQSYSIALGIPVASNSNDIFYISDTDLDLTSSLTVDLGSLDIELLNGQLLANSEEELPDAVILSGSENSEEAEEAEEEESQEEAENEQEEQEENQDEDEEPIQENEIIISKLTVGRYHGCVLFSNGRAKCWGKSSEAELFSPNLTGEDIGDDEGEMGENLEYVLADLPAFDGMGIIDVAAGVHSCIILDDHRLICSGYSEVGALGTEHTYGNYPTMEAVDVGASYYVTEVFLGQTSNTCAILYNSNTGIEDTLKCWGANDYGQLGQGNTTNVGNMTGDMGDNLLPINLGADRYATKVSIGNGNICALLDNGKIKCWGANNTGVLGLGNLEIRGDDENEMGDNLPYVDLGDGYVALDISTANDVSCAILEDFSLVCWGNNSNGQLGYGDWTLGIGDEPLEMGSNLRPVLLGTGKTAKKVSVGASGICAILNDDTIKCWGYNVGGVLGTADSNGTPILDLIGDSVEDMGDNLLPIDLGIGKTALELEVSAEPHFACAVLNDYSVKCWGQNELGSLGLELEDDNDKGDDENEMGDNLPEVDFGL
ncbi:MAG: hypothetical protein ABIA04_10705 [Pseudomonadota bacterium]